MTMLPMIERKDAFGRVFVKAEVRDDLIGKYVACIKCKGSGDDWHCTARGWTMTEYTNFRCRHCCGRGFWHEAMA